MGGFRLAVFRRETRALCGKGMTVLMLVVVACCWCVGPSQQAKTGFFIGNTGNYDSTGAHTLPTLVFRGPTSGDFEVYANSDFYNSIPPSFQYRMVPGTQPVDTSHAPWVSDKDILKVVSPSTNCADLLKATSITVKTGNPIVIPREVPLIPVPVSQVWVPENKKTAPITITSDDPGVARESLSACCKKEDCPEKCLEFTASQVWYLQISAPQWGYDGSRGGASGGMRDLGYSDPGLWPVFRVQCSYCPLSSCITECSNGEVILLSFSLFFPENKQEIDELVSSFPQVTPQSIRLQDSRLTTWNASRVSRAHGTRASMARPVSGTSSSLSFLQLARVPEI